MGINCTYGLNVGLSISFDLISDGKDVFFSYMSCNLRIILTNLEVILIMSVVLENIVSSYFSIQN